MYAGKEVCASKLCFESPCLILCIGAARTGKSSTITRLLTSKTAFPDYARIGVVAPHLDQPSIKRLRDFCHDNQIEFTSTDTYDEAFMKAFCEAKNGPGLLIIDDFISKLDDDRSLLTDLCCHLASHSCDVLITTQSLSCKSTAFRRAVQNASYLVIFPTIQLNASLRHLSGILFSHYRPFLSEIVNQYSCPFSYFIVDCRQTCESECRVRQFCLGDPNKLVNIFTVERQDE